MRSIDPVLLSKIKEQNQTIWNDANPKMSISVARAKSSIRDSTYFTIEKIREKEGITDVAVSARRMKPIGPPDRIYSIHIDSGVAKTSLREYPDKFKEHWKPQFDVGPATTVSICFDGRWHMNYKKTWGLQTDEEPWLFWVDLTGKLYARIWETGTAYELATDVVRLDSMRGWIPAQVGHTDDQGLIVAYIKSDGKVYYRNYCLQSDGVNVIWETEKEVILFGSSCLGIRLFRSNDFRVGFIAEKAAGNVMAVTKRNYAGMSIAPEKLHARVSAEVDFIEVEKINTFNGEYLSADVGLDELELCGIDVAEPAVVSAKRSGSSKVIIEFNQDIINYESSAYGFALSTGAITYTINSLGIGNTSKKIEITINETVDTTLSIGITYISSVGELRTYVDNYCKRLVGDFTATAIGAPQDGYLIEYLTASVSTTITYSEVFKSSGWMKDYLTASVSVTVQLWLVDDAPV